jgi:hypothetical protein
MIPASLLTDLAFRVNAAMASEHYDSLTADQVCAVAHREHLFDSLAIWLAEGGEPLNAIRQENRTALNAMFARMALVVAPEDFGIDRSGPRAALAFVMGMLFRGIDEVVSPNSESENTSYRT